MLLLKNVKLFDSSFVNFPKVGAYGEALAIKKEDADTAQGILTIKHAKKGRKRLVPIHESLSRMLESYCMALGIAGMPDAYIFPRRTFDKPLRNYDITNRFRRTTFMDWIEKERGCSASTRNQRFAVVCSFAEFAQNRNFDAAASFRSAVRRIPLKKTASREKAFFTADELKILFSLPDERTSAGLRDKVLLCVLYSFGARAQEICDLTVRKVRFRENSAEIDLVGKGRKARRVTVGNPSAEMLKMYISHRGIDHQLDRHVFSTLTHEMMSVSCVEAVVKKYVSAAKLEHPNLFLKEGYSPHSLCHSVAVHMLEAGVPLPVIQRFLGHASIMTTQVYARLAQEKVDSQIQKWNAAYWGKYQDDEVISSEKSHIPAFLQGK